jgi:hypothetical protein
MLPPGAARADLWRCCVVYRYGGVYVDADCACVVELDKLPQMATACMIVPVDTAQSQPNAKLALFQAFFAAEQGHAALMRCIQQIVTNVMTKQHLTNIFMLSGPLCFGRSLNEHYGRAITELWQPFDTTIPDLVLLFHYVASGIPKDDVIRDAHGRVLVRCQLPIDRSLAADHYNSWSNEALIL